MRIKLISLASSALVLMSLGSGTTMAAENQKIACSPELSKYSCNECFDGGTLYEGKEKTSLYDIVFNNGDLRNFYFADENAGNAINVFNHGKDIVLFAAPEFDYHPDFFTTNRTKFPAITDANPDNQDWVPATHPDGIVKNAAILEPGDRYKWVSTKPGKELSITTIDKSKITDANRVTLRNTTFVITYDIKTQFRNTATKSWAGSNVHRECQVVGSRWCGDGLVESGREQCDPNDPNKTNW